MTDVYEICPKCYGTLSPAHKCGPETLAKDDLCPKCLIILEDCSRAVFHYAKDVLQIQRDAENKDELPATLVLDRIRATLKRREARLLKEMENGYIKRS